MISEFVKKLRLTKLRFLYNFAVLGTFIAIQNAIIIKELFTLKKMNGNQGYSQTIDLIMNNTSNPSDPSLGDLCAAGLVVDLSYQHIDADDWSSLIDQAESANITKSIEDMFSGKIINTSERRPVLHTALRNTLKTPVVVNGQDVMPDICEVWGRIEKLCSQSDVITDVIHIGIGGSVFGPQLAVEALANLPNITSRGIRIHFAANVDSQELVGIFKTAIPATTRVIIVSKTFTTSETLVNAKSVISWLKSHGQTDQEIQKALLAVTADTAAASAFGISQENIFPFWEWVGGRFSVWSAVGICIALQYGFDTFMSFLGGAEAMDEHFRNAPIQKNIPILMALALRHQQEKSGITAYAVIPYANALSLFPSWLQQLDMECNGKCVDRLGRPINKSSPVVFGTVGTNSQHSYFQLLHQGTQVIPVDFIAVVEPMSDLPDAEHHHGLLLANCLAQAQALSCGKKSDNPNEVYPGNRPSNLVLLPKLDAFNLGALLALYESRAVALGILWGINSFDQPGVELGKKLAPPIFDALQQGVDTNLANMDRVTAERVLFIRG